MAEVYCIGNGEVFLNWYSYRDYCVKHGMKIMYPEPEK